MTTLFSVVMPTRNRAHLLPYALQTAVDQELDDCEIVVSDNCSDDGTREVVARFSDPRLRTVRTDRMLSMTESWEFALHQARGRYVVFLCDDDALCPGALAALAREVAASAPQVITWRAGHYFHDTFYREEVRNTVLVPEASGQTRTYESRDLLRDLYALDHGAEVPLMLNGAVRGEVVEAARARMGRFFVPFSPDYAAAAAILAHTERVTFLDEVWALSGAGTRVRPYLEHFKEVDAGRDSVAEFLGRDAGDVHDCVPLKAMVSINSIAQTLLAARKAMPERLGAYDLDWEEYFVGCYRQLQAYRQDGGDVDAELRELDGAVARLPVDVARRVRDRLAALPRSPGAGVIGTLRRGLRQVVSQNPWLSDLEFALRRRSIGMGEWRRVRGSSAGFHDIAKCARWVRDVGRGRN